MKKKDLSTLKGKSLEELKSLVAKKIAERDMAKLNISTNQEKNLKAYKNLKIEVARMLTLIREKSIVEALKPEEEEKK